MTKKIRIKNKSYFYQTWNTTSENCIFLCHGLGDNTHSFDKTIAFLLTQKIKIVGIDLLGHGINKENFGLFINNLELFAKIYEKEKSKNKNIVLGHSMGGLISLLSKSNRLIDPDELITIEPSITSADYNFFKYIQEPPIGVGLYTFSNNISKVGYLSTYKENLNNSNVDVLKENIKHIFDNFNIYQQKIEESNISFYYVFGNLSTEIDIRREMSVRKNINGLSFDEAEHWVHYDQSENFNLFLSTKL